MAIGEQFVTKAQFEIFSKNLSRRLTALGVTPVTSTTTVIHQGAERFTELLDCPDSYTGKHHYVLQPDAGEAYLEFTNTPQVADLYLSDELRLWNGAETKYTGFKGHADNASDLIWILPDADGVKYQALFSDGAFNLSWGWPGTENVVLGEGAAADATADLSATYYNTVIGFEAGRFLTTDCDCHTLIGNWAGYNISDAAFNTCIGYEAGYGITTGNDNIFIGNAPGYSSTITGNYNIGIGSGAGDSNTSGTSNISIGYLAGGADVGDNNICIGDLAGINLDAGASNILIGINAGVDIDGGNYNVIVGHDSGKKSVTGASNVFLGYEAGYYETGSNKLFIDNAKRTNEADARLKALIYGIFAAATADQYLYVNGNLDIREAIFIDGSQVIGPRVIDSRIDDTINSGDATTDGVIDAIRDALIAHGLVAAAS